MSQAPQGARHDAAGRAATKATAYGGSEAGAILGGAVGPPIIGGIIGGVVGEKVGEKSAGRFGVDETAKKVSDDLAKVVGQRNVDKLGEITLTALGYSSEEECVCCPCMPASQILFIIMLVFFGFNWYRLSIGIDYDWGCTGSITKSQTLEVPNENINETLVDNYYVSAEHEALNRTVFLIAYPCEWGFHYLVSGAAVWLAFLPFYITQLLGNCWRQCCCCLCDPLVCFACCVDVIKRYCCEIGRFNCISFIWHSMCLFQVCWACGGTYWLLKAVYFSEEDYRKWDVDNKLIKVVLASIVLDLVLAGSELFHKLRLVYAQKSTTTHPETQEMHQLNTNPC